MLNAQIIKEKALSLGACKVGIGDIKYFANTEAQRDPKMILPNARCVIGFAFRVPRYLYKVMENRTQFFNYTQLGVKYIDEDMAEIFLLKMAGLIENAGYDACVQRNVSNLRIKGDHTTNPELIDTYELKYAESISPDKPVPEIIMDFNQAAQICGLGEIGLHGHLIVPEVGPFVRLVFIVTDAPLECDEPFNNYLCDKCGECIKSCPGHAISETGIDSWQCAVYYRGAHKSNPFMKENTLKDESDRELILTGNKRFDSKSAREIYPKLDFLPSRPTGYMPCICGKACDMACFRHLKDKGLI